MQDYSYNLQFCIKILQYFPGNYPVGATNYPIGATTYPSLLWYAVLPDVDSHLALLVSCSVLWVTVKTFS